MRDSNARQLCLWALALVIVWPAVTLAEKRLPKHITPATEAAIQKGLRFLARTQGRDGAWRNNGRMGRYPVAMTSLAGLAMLADGNTTTQGKYAQNVDRAARYLLGSSSSSGLIARGGSDSRPMYGHGFSMLFLGQLYGMVESASRQQEIHRVLLRGVDLTARAQSRKGGWIYTPNSGGDEGSVTITQVQALRACRNAGVSVPIAVISEAMEYLVKSTNSDGGIAYRAGQSGPSRPAITAAAVCCWFNAGEYDNPMALRALAYCKDMIPSAHQRFGHWFYAQFYMAQAMYLAGEKEWDPFFPKLRDTLLKLQMEDGSWPGQNVGTVYSTAIALVVLQLPYEQLPIMQR
jgi:hypothetical protein